MNGTTFDWLTKPIPTDAIRRDALLWLWLAWIVIYWYAMSYSDYPNQIHWSAAFGVALVATMLFPWSSPLAALVGEGRKVPGLYRLIGLITLYQGAFYVVSLWELYPGTTWDWGKFELVQFPVAIAFYIVGRVCGYEDIVTFFHRLAVVIVTLTVAQMVLDPEQPRFGFGWQLMFCLPASYLLRKYWFVAVALLVMIASKHKTALGCALLGLGMAFIFSKLPPRPQLSHARYYMRVTLMLIAFTAAVGVAVALFPKIVDTIARFLPENTTEFMGVPVEGEGEDPSRIVVIEKSLEWLPDYLPWGIGYMNFSILLGAETGLTSGATRLNQEFIGINLHNSYMTWVLEGGIVVTSVVLLIFWRTGRRMRELFKNPATRNFGALALAWCSAALLLGGFHQLHALMQMWGTLGIIFGFYDQARRQT